MEGRSMSVRIAAPLWARIRDYHCSPGKCREALSYLYGRIEVVDGGLVLLLPEHAPYLAFAEDCFESRSGLHVRLRPEVLNGMLLDFAGSDYNCLINIHDHWFAEDAVFSDVDDRDDARFDRYLREQFEPMLRAHPEIGPARGIYNFSLVLGQQRHSARVVGPERQAIPVRDLWCIGEQLQRLPLCADREPALDATQLRHSYLGDTRATLARLRVGIAGCGGLGVVIAEALARMGVCHLTLVDADRLEASNLNRWQGATPADIGAGKAVLLAERLQQMVPGLSVRAVPHTLEHPVAQSALAACEVLIGGLDTGVARFQLNQLALAWLQPYFDAGVAITTEPETDFQTRYFAVIPGITGCACCKHPELIDRQQVAAALSSAEVRAQLRARGYVVDQASAPAPSAYRLNLRAAGLLLAELENYLCGWRPLATLAAESWRQDSLQRLDRERWPERPASDCPECSLRTGAGSGVALSTQAAALRAPETSDQAVAPS